MNIKLTKEQGDVVKFASTRHNMCIFGKAGVGKTTVVESIIKYLTAKG
jgi:nucleoside-triphosphatase THEP1